MIRLKRVYEPPASEDGKRFLVDRLWPRGVKREALQLEGWLQALAPSADLRRWFAHNPDRWDTFQKRYFVELDAHPEAWQPLLEMARRETITLVYAARDPEHNNAVALKSYLEARLSGAKPADSA